MLATIKFVNESHPPPVEARRQSLLARIRRRYQTVTADVAVGRAHFPFTRIANPDRVLDEVAEEADRREKYTGHREQEPLHLPYWAELWDSALGLGQWLERRCAAGDESRPTAVGGATDFRLINRMKVMDLGCGMGLSGTVAAALGAKVLFADLEPPALLFARLNTLPFSDRVRTRRLNWQTDTLDERFDLIIGADILYERSQWPFLEPFWRAHLALGGTVLLGEPGRQTGDLFLEWAPAHGWRVEQHAEPVATRPKPIRVFRLTR